MIRAGFNPDLAHWWAVEGTGEVTRHWYNPVCDRSVRRRFSNEPTPPPADKPVCARCRSIVSHPASLVDRQTGRQATIYTPPEDRITRDEWAASRRVS